VQEQGLPQIVMFAEPALEPIPIISVEDAITTSVIHVMPTRTFQSMADSQILISIN